MAKKNDNISFFRDRCLVNAQPGLEGAAWVNAGTGKATSHLDALDLSRPLYLLLTHAFRDHCDGARMFQSKDGTILGNYWEHQRWVRYDNRWDRHSPVRPLPISDGLMDKEKREIVGRNREVFPTPGASPAAFSNVVEIMKEGAEYFDCVHRLRTCQDDGNVPFEAEAQTAKLKP